MSEPVTQVANEQREAVPAITETKNDPFAILETEPIFASDKSKIPTLEVKETDVTKTPQELEAAKLESENKAKDEAAQLANKAKEYGLAETATKEEIAAAEKKASDELIVKAKELGLPETATKDEILAAEKAKNEPEGFITEDELNTGILGAEDGTWKALMIAKGHEVPVDYNEDNGFELFSQLEEAKWTSEIEKAKTEAQEAVLSTLKPELRAAIELANAMPDMTLEQILTPTLEIDNLLKLDKEELVRKEIEASNPNFTPEEVDVKMQQIRDANQIDVMNSMVRKGLEKDRVTIQEFQKQKINDYQAKQQQLKVADNQKQIEQINKVLDRDLTYLDKKLTDIDRQYLRKKIDEGYINELLNNPEKLVNAMLHDQFYTKGIASYKNRVREQALVELKQKQHNIPITTTGGGGSPTVVQKPITNQWDILKEDFGEKN